MARKEIEEEIVELQKLLQTEKEEDLRQYRLKMTNTSLAERRKQGVCWYPVFLEKTNFDSGERLLVRVSRRAEHRNAHLFQSGKMVSLFSNAGDNHENSEAAHGVVNQVKEYEMLITLTSDDVPDWIYSGQLGVQLLFDENSYREMEYALKKLITTKEDGISHLKHVLLGNTEAEFGDEPWVSAPGLNLSQNKALNKVLSALDVAIIHGPPGTGKTTTLIQSILYTLRSENQVMVCAPSNAAVDLLVDKLSEQGVNTVRIGHPARVSEDVLSHTLDYRITRHQQYKDLKTLRKKADEYKNLAQKHKRNFGREEREQRKLFYDEAHRLKDEADTISSYISSDILAKTQVIACTLVGAAQYILKGMHFRTVFIDEAAQALEPASWIPILKAERVIFAGDHCQLPPTIKSFEAARTGLEITLFEKVIQRNTADIMLQEQYRMNTEIMGFSSRMFYNEQLLAHNSVATHRIFEGDLAVEFIDTAGCGFFEQSDPETRSTLNTEEADLLLSHLKKYLELVESTGQFENIGSIGVISPYKAQVIQLQEILQEKDTLPENVRSMLAVNTVDSFQGQERDIIYISLVRSNEKGEIGFLSDTRRMNVAITRARKKLVVIGDSATICRHPFYNAFVDYVNEIGAYRSAFELLYS